MVLLFQGTTDLVKLEASLYDKYSVALTNVQILFVAGSGQDNQAEWEAARRTGAEQGMTALHILQPLSCALEVHQCIVHDPKRPLLRVVGKGRPSPFSTYAPYLLHKKQPTVMAFL